jgi:two-component system nitrate/nitrite response regulator NarL
MAPIRLLVADDHPLYRSSLGRALRQDTAVEVVDEVEDGRAALDAIRRLHPDVAVIDLEMPGVDGFGVIDTVRDERLPTQLVLLSGKLDSASAYAAIERGASGVLSKAADADELHDAIVAVAGGRTVIGEDVQSGIADQIRLRSTDDRPVLSGREREILGRMAEGETVPAIARALHLSASTVKSHVEQLYRKLGVSDRAAAVAVAMRRGMLR